MYCGIIANAWYSDAFFLSRIMFICLCIICEGVTIGVIYAIIASARYNVVAFAHEYFIVLLQVRDTVWLQRHKNIL